MKQRTLEMRLQSLEGFGSPKASLEQYSTPAKIAADILYLAHAMGDIEGRSVVDLGCGPGIFSVGACLLGAEKVTAIDVDETVLEAARRNAAKAGCDIEFICSGVEEAAGRFDTCVMNPPFGSQTRHADLPFLDRAMELADAVYSLHNAGTLDFLRARILKAGGTVDLERNYKMEIKHTFEFHTKERAFFDVALLRIVKP